eukprot:2966041-Pyramimonas_sp.AAC.1
MCHVHRRHVVRLTQWPWKLFGVADGRRPPLERMAIIHDFFEGSPPCCKPAGFARELQADQ